jgi:hypothetical protein
VVAMRCAQQGPGCRLAVLSGNGTSYAALWAEAAVLGHRDDAAARIERSRHAARGNPIATATVERASAIAAGDRDTLDRLVVTFARLGCPYQQTRTARLAAMPGS